MTFQKGHPLYPASASRPRVSRNRPRKEDYEPIASVPDGLVWKPAPYKPAKDRTVLFSFGNIYKLERVLSTGEVTYYQKRDAPAATPKEQIDAEPTRGYQVRYPVNAHCWYVENGRWFLMRVVRRSPKHCVITSVNGWDTEKEKEWPVGVELDMTVGGPLFKRLRPLKDRYL